MFKHLIAGIAAVSLTLSAPTQAAALDRDEVGKLIIGLAAIAALNAALESRDKRREVVAQPVHDRSRERQATRGNRWSDLNRQSNNRAIPHSCLQAVETRFGTQRMFGRRCLDRNYRHVNRLPDRCAVRVYTNNGPRRGFDPLCLREQGFRSDRRR